MIGFLLKILFGGVLPTLVLLVSIFLGWCGSHPSLPYEARFFAVVMPSFKGVQPPLFVGHGNMGAKATPPVPEGMDPKPRPANELFATLEGSGDQMPLAGLGMCCRPTAYDDVCVERSVEWFLMLGGRHIDGAMIYMNDVAIGRGLKNAMAKGIPRSEVFLTSKVYPTDFGYEATTKAVESVLEDVGVDYLDMVLMHAPKRHLPGPGAPGCKDLTPKECRQTTWQALSDLRAAGKIRNAGVSNFDVSHLQELLDLYYDSDRNNIAPVTNNQIQWGPFAPKEWWDVVEFCNQKNIRITAFNSLGGSLEKDKLEAVQTLEHLSKKHGRSVQAVLLRWAVQGGAAVIPGTGNPNYMEENLGVFDWELSEFEMEIIEGLGEELSEVMIGIIKPME